MDGASDSRITMADYVQIPDVESTSSMSRTTQTDNFKCMCIIPPQTEVFSGNCEFNVDDNNINKYCVDMANICKSHYMPVYPTVCSPVSPFGLCHFHNARSLCHYPMAWFPYQTYLPVNLSQLSPTMALPLPMLMPPYGNHAQLPSVLSGASNNASVNINACLKTRNYAPVQNSTTFSKESDNSSGKSLKYYKIVEEKRSSSGSSSSSNNNNNISNNSGSNVKNHKIKLLKRLEQKYLKTKLSEPKTNKCSSGDAFIYNESLTPSVNSFNQQSDVQSSTLSVCLSTDKLKDLSRNIRSVRSNSTDSSVVASKSFSRIPTRITEDFDTISSQSDCYYNGKHNPVVKRYVNRNLVENVNVEKENGVGTNGCTVNTSNVDVPQKCDDVSGNHVKEETFTDTKNMHEMAAILCDFNAKDENDTSEFYTDIIKKTIDIALRENSEQHDKYLERLKKNTSKVDTESEAKVMVLKSCSKSSNYCNDEICDDVVDEVPETPSVEPNKKQVSLQRTLNSGSSLVNLHKSVSNTCSMTNTSLDIKKYRSLSESMINEVRNSGVKEVKLLVNRKEQEKLCTRSENVNSLTNVSTGKSGSSLKSHNVNPAQSSDVSKCQNICVRSSVEKIAETNSFELNKKSFDDLQSNTYALNNTEQPENAVKRKLKRCQLIYKHNPLEGSTCSDNKTLIVTKAPPSKSDKYYSNIEDLFPVKDDDSKSTNRFVNDGNEFIRSQYIYSNGIASKDSSNDLVMSNKDGQIDEVSNNYVSVSTTNNDENDSVKKFENITAHFIIPNCGGSDTNGCNSTFSNSSGSKDFTEISFSVNYDPNNPELIMVDCAQGGKKLNESAYNMKDSNGSNDRPKDLMESIRNIVETNFYTEEPESNTLNKSESVSNEDWYEPENESEKVIQDNRLQEYNLLNQCNLTKKRQLSKMPQYSILNNIETLSIISEEDEDSRTNTTFKSTTTNTSNSESLDNRLPSDKNTAGNRIRFMNMLHNTCDMCTNGFSMNQTRFQFQ